LPQYIKSERLKSKLPAWLSPVLGSLLQGPFQDGQALLRALAERVVAMPGILLARMEFVGDGHGREHRDAD
jgi:hypothetical protein